MPLHHLCLPVHYAPYWLQADQNAQLTDLAGLTGPESLLRSTYTGGLVHIWTPTWIQKTLTRVSDSERAAQRGQQTNVGANLQAMRRNPVAHAQLGRA